MAEACNNNYVTLLIIITLIESMKIFFKNIPRDFCENSKANGVLFSEIFHRIIEINPDALKNRMDEFLGACKEDKGTYNMQIQVFYGLSNKHPEVCSDVLIDEYEKVFKKAIINVLV